MFTQSSSKVHQINKSKKDVISRGMNTINDMIAPDSIVNEKNFYVVGKNLIRTLMITGYPRTVRMGWLNDLYSLDANIDISIHIVPWDSTKVIKTLNKRIGQFSSTLKMDEDAGKISDKEVEIALEDAEELRDKLHTGSTKFFYQSIYISVSAPYLEELDQLTEDVESICGSKNITTRSCVYRQDQGFLSVIPLGSDRIRKTQNFDTDSVSTCFPLVSSELTDMRGNPILYGINRINNSLVMFDRFKLNNYNSVTLATSGAGKSYTVKLEALRYFLLGTKVIIIDPQNEYKDLAESVGGQFINLSASSKDRINPLDIYEGTEKEENQKGFLTAKIMDIFLMIQVMLGKNRDMTLNEKRAILTAIENMYKGFGITQEGFVEKSDEDLIIEKDFLTIGSEQQVMPTLYDLDAALKEIEEGTKIAEELEPYVSGVMSMFNGETNVDLNNDFVVFGIKDLEEGMRELAMFVCLEYVWNKIKSGNKERMLLTVDEAWMLMNNKYSRMFMEKVAKTARKFNAGLSVITQNIKDFMENGGEGIINNTSMQILLKQKHNEIHYLEEVLHISESEKTILKTIDVGEALIYAGQNKTLIDVISDEYEHQLCDTSGG